MTPQTLPPDAGTPYRKNVTMWDRLWLAVYKYDDLTGSQFAETAPGYTRGWGRSIAGLFQRQPPITTRTEPTGVDLPDLLSGTIHKAQGYGSVVLRPISDGVMWKLSVVKPTRFVVDWAERRPTRIMVWDTTTDPRNPDDERTGLAIIETWTPNPNGPGTVTTSVHEISTAIVNGTAGVGSTMSPVRARLALEEGWTVGDQIDTTNPPAGLDGHPYIVSAQNDTVARDMAVYVWDWDDIGPIPLWYTLEQTLVGLARLWDQEQDDAELARKRIAMPEDSIGTKVIYADDGTTILARPGFTKSDNLIGLSAQMSAQHGPSGGVTPIEFGDDLIQRERIEARENAVLEMAGINPSSIGRHVGGRSDSGEAKRADNQMTMNTISQPARHAAAVLTTAVREADRLNGIMWAADDRVIVREGLKPDDNESADTARMLRDADAASTRTLIATAHPTWDDEQIETELEEMRAENRAASPIE